jgi:hypothetical protein
MIAGLFWINLKQFFKSLKKPLNLLGHLAAVVIIFGYGLLLGLAENEIIKKFEVRLNVHQLDVMLLGFIAFITLVRMFRPTYIPQERIEKRYYPISKIQRYFLNVSIDFQQNYFVYFTVFLLGTTITKDLDEYTFLLSALSILVGAHLVRRWIQYPIDFKLKKSALIPILLGGITIFAVAVLFPDYPQTIFIIPFVFFILGGWLDSMIHYPKNASTTQTKKSSNNFYWNLIWKNDRVRKLLLIGLIMKFVMLTADLINELTQGTSLFNQQFIYWLIVSPSILFTYVFNNVWGFWSKLWLNFAIHSTSFKNVVLIVFNVMLFPIAADIILTFSIVSFTKINLFFLASFYFTDLFFLMALSIIWSTVVAKKIESKQKRKSITSQWGVFVAFMLTAILSVMRLNSWLYFLVPLFLIFGIIVLKVAYDLYPEKKYKLFATLFKE